jgi:energy-coupling factor transport system substrate-specific component
MFLLIILTGYVFGARVGFLMGALSLMVSALITGGVGPWLPF